MMKTEKIVLEISTPIPENMAMRLLLAIKAVAEVNIVSDYVAVRRESL